jgi:hypothetical protein
VAPAAAIATPSKTAMNLRRAIVVLSPPETGRTSYNKMEQI